MSERVEPSNTRVRGMFLDRWGRGGCDSNCSTCQSSTPCNVAERAMSSALSNALEKKREVNNLAIKGDGPFTSLDTTTK